MTTSGGLSFTSRAFGTRRDQPWPFRTAASTLVLAASLLASWRSPAAADPVCTTGSGGIVTCDHGGEDVFLLENTTWTDRHLNIGILTIGEAFTLQALAGRSLTIQAQLVDVRGHLSADIPLTERWNEPDLQLVDAGRATLDEARALGYLPLEGFAEVIESFWKELGERVGNGGRITYWDWIGADTYEETVKRSYLTVFLVSYGYANIESDRFGEKIEIIHNKEPLPDPGQAKISIPTLVDYEEWKIWRKG